MAQILDAPEFAVIGRKSELATIRGFVASIPAGPRSLVLEGAAGIGKTTLWLEAAAMAQRAGYRVREIPFALRQRNDTRIDFLRDSPRMFRDLFLIRLNALRGVYGR